MTDTAAKVASHRTDADIFVDARNALDRRRTVPEGVHAHVAHGVVTLTGTARLPFDRADAEDAVRHIEGVQRVVNHITVAQAPTEGFEPPDELC